MEQITLSSLVVQSKLKFLLKKPTPDDIIEAKEVYIQQSFGSYKGKLVLRNLSPSVYLQVEPKPRILRSAGFSCAS